jgi:outer membrane protein TolC
VYLRLRRRRRDLLDGVGAHPDAARAARREAEPTREPPLLRRARVRSRRLRNEPQVLEAMRAAQKEVTELGLNRAARFPRHRLSEKGGR